MSTKEKTSNYKPLYPTKFEDAKMDVPESQNVEFSFVVKAPKEYVMDAWNLPKEHSGEIDVFTEGNPVDGESWPGIANDMERAIISFGVTQVVGNVQTPEEGDWHFEWKAGAPYFKMPFPISAIMKSVHGTATLADGPGPNETTVTVVNRQRPGLFLWFTRLAAKAATPGLAKAAPERFAQKKFVGPQKL